MLLFKTNQFYGIDLKPFAVELTEATLIIAKKLANNEEKSSINQLQRNIPIETKEVLPLDNLNDNIQCKDSLLTE